MNGVERRQYEMLLRVRNFSKAYGGLFTASAAQEAFASVNSAIDALTTAARDKLSASQAARAHRKRQARKALIELLVDVGQLARVLRTRDERVPQLGPPQSKSAQVLLTTARRFAQDVAPFDAEFSGHGVGSAVITETAAVFDKAVRGRESKRADYIAARVQIRVLLTSAFLDARRLDLIVRRELGSSDNPIRAVWKQARHVERPRRGRGAGVATVIDMPTREAA